MIEICAVFYSGRCPKSTSTPPPNLPSPICNQYTTLSSHPIRCTGLYISHLSPVAATLHHRLKFEKMMFLTLVALRIYSGIDLTIGVICWEQLRGVVSVWSCCMGVIQSEGGLFLGVYLLRGNDRASIRWKPLHNQVSYLVTLLCCFIFWHC